MQYCIVLCYVVWFGAVFLVRAPFHAMLNCAVLCCNVQDTKSHTARRVAFW